MAKIVLDPGHGGAQRIGGSSPNNATGPNGTLEKELTLAVGLMVSGLLANLGHQIRMTRTKDVNLGLAERAKIGEVFTADVFVSIHFNGFHDPNVQGTETLHAPEASESSRRLARLVQKKMVDATGYRDRGVKSQELGVLRPSRHHKLTAACLVEVSFLTDPVEEQRLAKETYQLRIATAIAEAIAEFCSDDSG
jgi:N-acetylmuramoyl-L-alanine amidase